MFGDKKVGAASALTFEADLGVQFLPGCPKCKTPHPLALKGAYDRNVCPGCGDAVQQPGEVMVVEAAVGGFHGWVADKFLKIGRALSRLAREI